MSPETKDNLQFEFSQIMKEAEITEILIPLFRENRIDDIQIRGAASTIHSIYNGVERVLVLVLKDLKITVPAGGKWHTELLLIAKNRGIVSEDTYRKLRDFQSFRHFFRHSYGFMLDPELLFPLVEASVSLVESLKTDILSGT